MKNVFLILALLFFVNIANGQIVEVLALPGSGYSGNQKFEFNFPLGSNEDIKKLKPEIEKQVRSIEVLNILDKAGFKLISSSFTHTGGHYTTKIHYYVFKKE